MATKKRQQTMAKREREQNVRDRRAEKLLKKRSRGEATEELPAVSEPTPEPS